MKTYISNIIKKNMKRTKHLANLLCRAYVPKVVKNSRTIVSTNCLPDIPRGAVELNSYVTEVYNNRKAIITIISDDGEYETGLYLNELFAMHNFKCTVSGVVRVINPYIKKWKKLLEKGNIDLVNHSFNHIGMHDDSTISQDDIALSHEIIDSNWYYENYFDFFPIAFVCPEGVMCQKGYDKIEECKYYAVRGGVRGYNNLSPNYGTKAGEWLNLKCQGIKDSNVDGKIRNAWVDEAIQNKRWLIEMWHNVSKDSDKEGYQTLLFKEAEEHLEYIQQKNDKKDIWVASFSDAIKYIYERQNARIVAYLYNNRLYVGATLTDKKMDARVFNHPISIALTLSKKNESDIIMVNIVPNGIVNEFNVSDRK